MRRKEVEEKMSAIVEYAELAELADDIDHPVRTYSSGMMARLGFAIAIQASPNVLLTYEVLGVGDANFRKKSHTILVNLINSDRTVVIVPHNEDTLRQHCDRVVWTDAGTTKMIGPSEQVLSEYSKVMNT
jgi:lipopolysaccharide transport system ATP-binding protein